MTTTEQPAALTRNADINKLCPPRRVHDDTLYAQWVINCARILDPTDDALVTEAEKDSWNAWKVEAEDCARWLAGYVDLLHEYALKINPRGVIGIEIVGSEHGWGTRIVKPCRMVDDYICGVTGTTECTATEAQQRTCPVC